MKGSEHNDPLELKEGEAATSKNASGGVNGGITNGSPIVFRVAFKPTSSITRSQSTLNVPGRHDVCFALRTPVIVESVAAIVFADLLSRR